MFEAFSLRDVPCDQREQWLPRSVEIAKRSVGEQLAAVAPEMNQAINRDVRLMVGLSNALTEQFARFG